MPEVNGLFLDLDGTLADSLSVMRGVYDRFLSHHEKVGSDAEFAAVDGPPLAGVIAVLRENHAIAGTVADLEHVYVRFILEAYDQVQPKPGAAALIARARRHGWRTAVVTSSREELTRHWLTRTGLADSVDVVIGADSVVLGKPDPEPYLRALEQTGCTASASVAVEDSPRGATAAVAAGLRVFALVSPLHGVASYPPGAVPLAAFADVEKALFDA